MDLPESPTDMRYVGTQYAVWEAEQIARDYLALASEFIDVSFSLPWTYRTAELEVRERQHILFTVKLLNEVFGMEYGYEFGCVESDINPEFLY